MSHSVKSLDEEILMDSWVDLNGTGELSRGSDSSQKRSTPISSLLSSGKLEKLLLEAQRESCQSSLVGSAVSSHRDSPKSPRSPVVEDASLDDLLPPQQCDAGQRRHGSTDWIWEWSSKPEQRPPKLLSQLTDGVPHGSTSCFYVDGSSYDTAHTLKALLQDNVSLVYLGNLQDMNRVENL
ncbi:uncharacterized protein CEXT_684551 [Caerostris extrusa]|uniref:Uncharacterized protein n=1 Tax=Caerostris extrusa TaxID=172846 RepID=A0AAV4XYL7_CAEEX|nr:uncharacterized protein CEXT_684551 [Caerostris extrusa]